MRYGLADWLDTLRARGITITVSPDGVRLDGPTVELDFHWLGRFHGALMAARDHPVWWQALVMREDGVDAEDAPDGCALFGCDGELAFYSPEAVPYCALHHPDWWLAGLPETEVAA